MMRTLPLTILLFICNTCFAQDSLYIHVHFLYGSKPLKQYRESESKWFGGIMGGHAGIGIDSNRILNFVPSGKFHVIAKRKDRHSRFAIHSETGFYNILGNIRGNAKKAVVRIPVSAVQKQTLDSIATAYLSKTPYDYAFIGMRCGAAAYDILARLDILPAYTYRKTYMKIFFPGLLRARLFRLARANGWTIQRQNGSPSRKWEKDKLLLSRVVSP